MLSTSPPASSRLRTTSFVRYRLTTIDGFAQRVRNQLVWSRFLWRHGNLVPNRGHDRNPSR